MDAIRELIEWVANDSGSAFATLFPFLLLGLAGLYLLWFIIGYLRVSQVGIGEATEGDAHAGEQAAPLPHAPDGSLAAPRGLPYCETDALQFPSGTRFCPVCERDLVIDCASCGATLRASDASCYRCGTPTGVAERALLT